VSRVPILTTGTALRSQTAPIGGVKAIRLERVRAASQRHCMSRRSPFRYFRTSPEIIRLAVMMYVRFPLSLRNVEDLLHERGIDVSHETVRFWWQWFGPMFAAEIRRRRVERMQASRWRCWGGRPPTASMCQTEVVVDLRQGDRPWNRLAASAWIRRSTFSNCMA